MHPTTVPPTRKGALRLVAIAGAMLLAVLPLSGCFLVPRVDHHGIQALDGGETVVGAWLGSWPADGNPVIEEFEDEVGVPLDLVDVYLDWFTPFENVSHTVSHIADRGSVAILSWEAQTLTTQDILAGERTLSLRDGRKAPLDDYLEEFAKGACAVADETGQPVLVRLLHEMNGAWFAWGISYEDSRGNRPNSDDSYRRAWIKIHDAFDSRCGNDVRFVWAVNHFSVGAGTSFTGPYPGDEYVDYLGIDGYNWGSNAAWGWQGFDTLFKPGYCALVGLSEKPILIAEVASTERGGSKEQWIREFYSKLDQYDRLRGFVWLHDAKYEVQVDGPMDWPVDSSPASLAAFEEGAQAIVARRDSGGSAPQGGAGPGCPS